MQALCFYMFESEEEHALSDLVDCFVNKSKTDEEMLYTLDELFVRKEEQNLNSTAVQCYKVFCDAAQKEKIHHVNSVIKKLEVFLSLGMRRLTGSDDIDLYTLGEKPVALFCIPDLNNPDKNILETILYRQSFDTIYYQAYHGYNNKCRLLSPVRYFLEYFEDIGKIQDLENKLATMRPYDISMVLCVNAFDRFLEKYPENYEIILGNCDTHLLWRTDKNSKKKEYRNYLYYNYIGKPAAVDIRNYKKKSWIEKRFLSDQTITLNEEVLTHLKDDECLILVRGTDVFLDKKYVPQK